jgi:phage tail sheath protein FI
MFLIDSPRAWQTAAQAEAGVQAMQADSSYGALYYPWVKIIDPLQGNRAVNTPPSGHVAGVYARTDAARGVWKAPAGTEARLLGVCELSEAVTAKESEDLNRSSINCLRSLSGLDCAIWGARTLSSDRERRYIPVRRLVLLLEASIDRNTQWTVFETNDERLWQQVRLSVEAFMESLFRQGAFQGRSPDEAYFVRCGRDTTTENDIKLGIVNIEIGFAPLRPGEFVIIKIQQRTGHGAS